jgi:hypothetical protein
MLEPGLMVTPYVRLERLIGKGGLSNAQTPSLLPVTQDIATELAAGARHGCAWWGSKLRCLGANDKGQLGIGTSTAMPFPTPVTL